MKLKLEQLEYQRQAIDAVISIFKGQVKNTFDNACSEGVRANFLSVKEDEINNNIKQVIHGNGLCKETAKLEKTNDLCIEMETGTGKTIVYIKTILELYKHYGFTKFIILVPSVAIKEGVLNTLNTFEKQLENVYNIKPDYYEYDSGQLSKVINFIEEQHPQIMIMTLQSFNTDDRILNQPQRENLFANMPYIEAIASTNPIIIMDEPQEGMDTANSIARLKKINPLFKIRYSATHKVLRNLVYRLTPYDSYKQGLVKKIEVLTVSEKNDEASMKIELSKIELGKSEPKAVLKAWHQTKTGFRFKNTRKLDKNAGLHEVTGNIIYKDYIIEQIAKPIRGRGFIKFKNGTILYEGDQAKNHSSIFSEQLYWLIDSHFRKKEKLKEKKVKCLSLIFIDRVDNYIRPDGIVKNTFVKQYKKVHKEHYGKEATDKQVEKCQGYYFARTGKGDFTDNERSMASNRKLFDLILKDKEELLKINNPVEFVFSHSALGVGWDNPNVFNIATLNQSYSEIRKRQEIGRGLRICVNQNGQRLYDNAETPEGEEINLLTIIPNETYETFVYQYQSEIEEVYGTSEVGAETRNTHRGTKRTERLINRNDALFHSPSFREFWKRLSQKTEYLVAFDESELVKSSIATVNEITVPEPQMQISLARIKDISNRGLKTQYFGTENKKMPTVFSAIDLVEEISESTGVAYATVFKIVKGIKNKKEIVRNPHLFLQEAIRRIRDIELDEMVRALDYRVTGETFTIEQFQQSLIKNSDKIEPTPNKGIYDHIIWDSKYEQKFAQEVDTDTEVVCFLKLPSFYVIKTPVGEYSPDFGLVLKKKKIREDKESEYYFVIEIKGTNNIDDRTALTKNEIYKIKCAVKHFEALGIEAEINYFAPVKEYKYLKEKVDEIRNQAIS